MRNVEEITADDVGKVFALVVRRSDYNPITLFIKIWNGDGSVRVQRTTGDETNNWISAWPKVGDHCPNFYHSKLIATSWTVMELYQILEIIEIIQEDLPRYPDCKLTFGEPVQVEAS